MFDDELPELSTLILRPNIAPAKTLRLPTTGLRRSPRKQPGTTNASARTVLADVPVFSASSQQRISPQKAASPNRAALKSSLAKTQPALLEDVPRLGPISQKAGSRSKPSTAILTDTESDDCLSVMLEPISKHSLDHNQHNSGSEKENIATMSKRNGKKPTSTMSKITQAAKKQTQAVPVTKARRKGQPQISNPYILKEAHCEDLNESSGTDGEDEDTDLSGFIVDDNADLSACGSAQEEPSLESETQRRPRRRQMALPAEARPQRRLVRGRREQNQVLLDEDDDQDLAKAFDGMNLGNRTLEKEKNIAKRKNLEVIDLTSSPVQLATQPPAGEEAEQDDQELDLTSLDPFPRFSTALKLHPPNKYQPQLLPSKTGPLLSSTKRPSRKEVEIVQPATPPATPPQSPSKTKLKSPSKLLSPSKHKTEAPRSPHRQSMDAFWDHNVINEWHDTVSPKKAPTLSPRKNPLARFNLFASDDIESSSDIDSSQPTMNSSQDPFDESTDSLPSPSESPSKTRSPSKVSALKAEQARIREEKRAKLAAKKKFDSEKEKMALDLLLALDRHVTDSKISTMSASTGGIQVLWSKTLRSTAGRANWKRTVTKPSGSPVKGDLNSQTIERQPGVIVQHFASIELAEKIIDRPERLVNTLAHEFCHLANFMVSGIRDQPHGESFKRWGKKVTSWLHSSAAKRAIGWREEWMLAEVTTKHSYVVETKYLWVCSGRPAERQKQTLAMRMLNIKAEDEDGCGAEYGRHSKSIDIEKQRCGRCKGFLVQVRPTPRLSSPRKSPVKNALRRVREESGSGSSSGVEGLEKLMAIVELSD